MSIRTTCQSCGKAVKAPDSAAGKRGKCPFCGHSVRIPSLPPPPEPAPIDSTPGGSSNDSQQHHLPVMSVKAKRLGRKKEPWGLDIYDTHAIFTDPENSKQFRFPNETKDHGFATPFISGYNFVFVPYSRQYRFLIDKEVLSELKAIHSNWARLRKAQRADQYPSTIDFKERKPLVAHVRFWSGLQLVVIAVTIVISCISPSFRQNRLAPLLIVGLLLWGVVAFYAWRLQRWAILCEVVLFTGSSLWNLTAWLFLGSGAKAGLFLAVSATVAAEFYRAFKADLRSSERSTAKG